MSLNLVDHVIELDKRTYRGRQDSLRRLQSFTYDHVICPHESLRSAIWVASLEVRGHRISFQRWFSWFFFDQRIQKPCHLPDALRQLSLLVPLHGSFSEAFGQLSEGLESTSIKDSIDFRAGAKIPESVNMVLPLSPNNSDVERFHLNDFVALAPGSVWPTKQWPTSSYSILARELIEQGFEVVLIGGKSELKSCEQIAADNPVVHNLCGQTNLQQLRALLAKAKLLVANDSGAAHMASTVGVPIVSIFGPTILEQGFRPWTNELFVVQRDLQCRPCGRHGGKKCPLETHECMKSITVQEVKEAVQALMH